MKWMLFISMFGVLAGWGVGLVTGSVSVLISCETTGSYKHFLLADPVICEKRAPK